MLYKKNLFLITMIFAVVKMSVAMEKPKTLMNAVLWKKFDFAQQLLNEGANPNDETFQGGQSILMVACCLAPQDKNNATARLCIEKGAQLDIKDFNGNTALHWACMDNRNSTLVELLLTKYADAAKIQNQDGQTPLSLALTKNYIEIIEVFHKFFDIKKNKETEKLLSLINPLNK